MKSVWLH